MGWFTKKRVVIVAEATAAGAGVIAAGLAIVFEQAAWGAIAALAAAVVALLAIWNRRLEAPSVQWTDPAVVKRLAAEAAFSIYVRLWPDNTNDADWVLEQLEKELAHTIIVSRKDADEALEASRRIQEKEMTIRPESDYMGGYETVRQMLVPVLEMVPTPEVYLNHFKSVPPELRIQVLENNYDMAEIAHDEDAAWAYLQLIEKLGHKDALLSLCKRRLLETDPYMQRAKYVATADLAHDVLGNRFKKWFHTEIPEEHRP